MVVEMFRYPFIQSKLPASLRQRHSSDCGPTCLAMVAHYFHPLSSELTNLPAVAHPATAAEMVDLAMLVGLSASPCKVAMDELARLKRPAILHWNLDHWVVLWAVTANGYLIDNPAIGRAWISTNEVNRAFSGIVIVCEPRGTSHRLDTHHSGDSTHQYMTSRQKIAPPKHSKHWTWLSGWTLILATCQLTTPFILKAMIEWVPISQHWGLLAWLVFLFALGQVMAALTDRLVRQSTVGQLTSETSSNPGSVASHDSDEARMSSLSEQAISEQPIGSTTTDSIGRQVPYFVRREREHVELNSSLRDDDRLSAYALIILPLVTIVMGAQWIITIPLLALDAALITLTTRRHARRQQRLTNDEQQKAAILDADRKVLWHHHVTRSGLDSINTLASARFQTLTALWRSSYRSLQLARIDDDTQQSIVSTIARSLFLGSIVAGYAVGSISMGTFFVLTHYQAIFRLHFENFIRHTLSTPSAQIQVARSPASQTRGLDADQVLPRDHRIKLAPKKLTPRGGHNNCHGKRLNNVPNKGSYQAPYQNRATDTATRVAWLDTKTLPFTIHQALDQCDRRLLFDLAAQLSTPDEQLHSQWTICNFELPLATASVIDQLTTFELNPNIDKAWQSLASVGIDQRVRASPYGLNNKVSVTGSPFSQESRARFALAVAIYHSPKILFIDHRKQRFSNAEISELIASIGVLVPLTIYLSAIELDERPFTDQSIQHFEVLEPSAV
jgi:ATP-binding cassette subfamily B protein RaxB